MAKRGKAEKLLKAVLRPEIATIFAKPGRLWDVAEADDSVPAADLAFDLDSPDPARRRGALRRMAAQGRAAVCHPDLLPLLVQRLLDSDAGVRREADALRDQFLHERNAVYDWVHEPAQERRWLAVASRRVGRDYANDAWQQFSYNTRKVEENPRFYFYSLPNVISSYDPGKPEAVPFPNYYLQRFKKFCMKNYRRLRGDPPADSPVATGRSAAPIEEVAKVPAAFADIMAVNAELNFLFRHSLLLPKELACLVRRLVHELEDDEEMPGEDTHGIAPADRKVYFHRGRLKLRAARAFFARMDSLPTAYRAVVREAYVKEGAGPPALPGSAPARGEEILLAEGYVDEIRALGDDPAIGLPARERDVALLHHGEEHLEIPAIAARLGYTIDEVTIDLQRMHGRIHTLRLARYRVDADTTKRRGLLEERFIGDLETLDALHRRVAVQICVRWPLVSDAARFLKMTIPKVTRALVEAQGVPLDGSGAEEG